MPNRPTQDIGLLSETGAHAWVAWREYFGGLQHQLDGKTPLHESFEAELAREELLRARELFETMFLQASLSRPQLGPVIAEARRAYVNLVGNELSNPDQRIEMDRSIFLPTESQNHSDESILLSSLKKMRDRYRETLPYLRIIVEKQEPNSSLTITVKLPSLDLRAYADLLAHNQEAQNLVGEIHQLQGAIETIATIEPDELKRDFN